MTTGNPDLRVVATQCAACKGVVPIHTNAPGRNALQPAADRDPNCWFTIDREWVIADCGDGVPGVIAQSVGMTIWDAFPGSKPKFGALYNKAWDTGMAAGVVYWNETFTALEMFVRGDHLLVSFHFMPVSGLESAIAEILEARKGSQRNVPERSLRLVRPV